MSETVYWVRPVLSWLQIVGLGAFVVLDLGLIIFCLRNIRRPVVNKLILSLAFSTMLGVSHGDEITVVPAGNGMVKIRTVSIEEKIVPAIKQAETIKSDVALKEKQISFTRGQLAVAEERVEELRGAITNMDSDKERVVKILEKINEVIAEKIDPREVVAIK